MGIKWLIILVILMAIEVHAGDEQLYIPPTGDEEFVIGYIGDQDMFFFGEEPPVTPPAAPEDIARNAPGGAKQAKKAGRAITPYYDLIIKGLKATYKQEEIVKFTIMILNKGDIPDRDVNLTYYLVSPEETLHGEAREVFEEVEVMCPNATFDEYVQKCMYVNLTTFEPFVIELPREIALPHNTSIGEWRLYTSLETEVQDDIHIYQSFRVDKKLSKLMMLLIFLILLFIVGIAERKRRTKKKKKKEEEKNDIPIE